MNIGRDEHRTHHSPLHQMALGALGIVYGDIGTSPLYTMRESFAGPHAVPLDDVHVYGVLSMVFWALVVSVTLKYVVLLLRADNEGEGGVLALGTLAAKFLSPQNPRRNIYITLAIVGLTLFYGDCLITPAISVLGAVEGVLSVEGLQQPGLDLASMVPWMAALILIGLFFIQSGGTAQVGKMFGPIMVIWFVSLALMGLWQISQHPEILAAISPHYLFRLIEIDGLRVFLLMGTIVLAITGAEALFADLGHFGRKPIQITWLAMVFPCLVINYFGQGALILADPSTADKIFFRQVPDVLVIPLVVLATLASIIASQAVISGIFSMTKQAILLGLLPRMEIRHTSSVEAGQIYMPHINWILMVGVLLLVFGFQTSGNLAAAYGVSVTGTVIIDSILACAVALSVWKWSRVLAFSVFGVLLIVDAAFFISCLHKVPDGGWFPLVICAAIVSLITIWRHGRRVLYDKLYKDATKIVDFLGQTNHYTRIAGTAVYLTSDPARMPKAMQHNLLHNRVLHDRIILLTVKIEPVPWWPRGQRVAILPLGQNIFTIIAHYGFMDRPDVPRVLRRCADQGLLIDPQKCSYFLSREIIIPTKLPDMGPVEARIFSFLSDQAMNATSFFRLPADRVLELCTRVEV